MSRAHTRRDRDSERDGNTRGKRDGKTVAKKRRGGKTHTWGGGSEQQAVRTWPALLLSAAIIFNRLEKKKFSVFYFIDCKSAKEALRVAHCRHSHSHSPTFEDVKDVKDASQN